MMQRIQLSLAALIAAMVPTLALAGPYDSLRDKNKEWSAQRLAAATEAQADLEASAVTGWEDLKAEEYLLASIEAVYFAYTAYVWDKDQLPSRPEELVEGGYLKEWPGNPFNAGERAR